MSAFLYILANGVFGWVAFWFSVALGVVPVADLGASAVPFGAGSIRDALLVGFGAVIILRGVAFKLSVGGKTNDVGPSTIVDTLLKTCDQGIDRSVAAARDRDVRIIMKDVSFEKAKLFVPVYCLSLVQPDDPRSTRLGQLIASIDAFRRGEPAADDQRAFLLGSTLVAIFGTQVTKGVIEGFRSQLTTTAPPGLQG